MRKLIILALFIIASVTASAQEIAPVDLFQIYRTWRLVASGFDKSTYDYVRTVDIHWQLRAEPKRDAEGLTILMAYEKDKAWYKDDQHGLMLIDNVKPRASRSLVYMFTDADNWKRYQRQMQIMGAKVFDSAQRDGGSQITYVVNDIYITLREFPPGMNGDERQYHVQVTEL